GKPVSLLVDRAGQRLDVALVLAERGDGDARAGYLGAGVQGVEWPAEMLREVSFGPLAAVGEGLSRTWTMSLLTLDSLKKMLFGELSVKNL
ncbi:MAG TPA: zinc metallopeptidase RseP, partial [Pseudomonas sp.]|nr:zinc metallopeptidase RseP [Pseudomonas sp.]